MARVLPRLRTNLEFMPSPVEDRPGLLIRDSLRYSDFTLIIPPLLVQCLRCFDGQQTDLDLRQMLVHMTGDLRVGEAGQNLIDSLSNAGFLENEVYANLREGKHRAYSESAYRAASLAGAAYADTSEALQTELAGYLNHNSAAGAREPLGIAAPHVSLEGGRECYGAAYGALPPQYGDRTFVVLGTSHYGQPDSFGLTRKPYRTPIGDTTPALDLIEELEVKGGEAARPEDYCHSVEHSVEFQVLFLQHLFGAGVRILPILCGSLGHASSEDGVDRFIGALAEIAARESRGLCWVLGIDMAHIGRRYGDPAPASAGRGRMVDVEERDRRRLERVAAGDADGFWKLVRADDDDLHWCGASAIYTFLKACPGARGELLRYEQWNIDEASVVSFAALAFHSGLCA